LNPTRGDPRGARAAGEITVVCAIRKQAVARPNMSLGLQERQQRAKRRMWVNLLRGAAAAVVVIVCAAFAYLTGYDLAKIDLAKQQRRIDEQQAAIKVLETEKQRLVITAKAAADQVQEWERKYQLGVPNGISKTLFDRMQAKLQSGVPPDRMALFIEQSSKPRSCDPQPEREQLYVRTGIGKAGKFETTFGGHRLTVALNGEPAVNAEGQKEAWFDTAKPITVTLTDPVGQSTELNSVLPLNHQLVVADSEFRLSFAVEEKRRGYALVISARCNFP
jgi:hypothetical protein